MKKLIYLVLCFLYFGAVNAQERYFDERYIYTQSHVNPVLINPGANGYNGGHEILFNYNNRWASFEGSPKTFTVAYNGIASQRLGIGALVMKDNYGPLAMTKAQGSVSYGFSTVKNKIRVGLTGEYISYGLEDVYNSVEPGDLLIENAIDGSQYFDLTIGLMGEFEERLSYGLVLPSLVSSRLDTDSTSVSDNGFSYILNVGYLIDVPVYDFKVIPSIYVKKLNGVPGHIDMNLLFKFMEDKLTGGVTYSVGGENRLGFLLGVAINKLDFHYSYNISNNNFQHYNNGSHEITLGMRLSDMVAN